MSSCETLHSFAILRSDFAALAVRILEERLFVSMWGAERVGKMFRLPTYADRKILSNFIDILLRSEHDGTSLQQPGHEKWTT